MGQQEDTKELLELIKCNPEIEIVPMVDTDLGCEDYGQVMGCWGKANLDEYWCNDKRIYFKSEDYEEIVEDLIDKGKFPVGEGWTEVQIEEKANKIVDGYDWEKCISIRINVRD